MNLLRVRGFVAAAWIVALLSAVPLARGFAGPEPLQGSGEMFDRIVATVNGHIILQSDWDDALRYETFMDARSPDHLTGDDRKAALDRLIDQELLREQMRASDFQHASDEEIQKRLAEIRTQYPGAETQGNWQSTLARYGLQESELKTRVALQFDLIRLVDARLRPNVTIDTQSIESYYNQELLPQLRQSGAQEVPLVDASPKIKELLTQQKVSQLLVAWLHDLRAGSEIRTPDGGSQMQ
jgi:peptidyl-prolyl cis-trans isomerase SurA